MCDDPGSGAQGNGDPVESLKAPTSALEHIHWELLRVVSSRMEVSNDESPVILAVARHCNAHVSRFWRLYK